MGSDRELLLYKDVGLLVEPESLASTAPGRAAAPGVLGRRVVYINNLETGPRGRPRASSGRRSGGVGDSAGGALSTGGVSSARGFFEEARGGGGAILLKKGAVCRRAGADCGTARGSRAAARSTSTKGSCELVLALLAGDGAGLRGRRRRDAAAAVSACRSRRRWMRTFVR